MQCPKCGADNPDDAFFCTDGLCTHESVHLADGLVMDHVIECPKHNGQFDYRTGEALRMPARINGKGWNSCSSRFQKKRDLFWKQDAPKACLL